VLDDVVEVPAAPLQCLMVDRAAYVAAGGLLGSGDDPDCASIDLCERLRARGGRIVHAPSALVVDSRDVRSRRSLRSPVEPDSTAWDDVIAKWGPQLAHSTRTGARSPMRLAISTAVPSRQVCRRWGDWHVAEALARALRRQGIDIVVSTHPEAASPAVRSCDVHLVLRGLAPVDRTPGQAHILWVISHPETIDVTECDAADLVLVASPLFADELRERTSTPVEVLLQATDPDRFCPGPPSREHRHDVTVVAKSRDVRRRIVTDAIEAGLEPTIYGSGWRGLVEPRLVRGGYIDNAYLPHVYRSAGVVLNDHWDTMRRSGFVSNRLYDVLACGTPVISDEVAGIAELFDDAVPTYRTAEDLASLVHHALDEPELARAAAARGRAAVLRRHTFDHRAQQLLALLRDHQLDVRGRTPLPT
jgi:glycosyltransferase involved in cell wall biosynthesis